MAFLSKFRWTPDPHGVYGYSSDVGTVYTTATSLALQIRAAFSPQEAGG